MYDAIGRNGPKCNEALSEGIAVLELLVDDTNEWGGLQGESYIEKISSLTFGNLFLK